MLMSTLLFVPAVLPTRTLPCASWSVGKRGGDPILDGGLRPLIALLIDEPVRLSSKLSRKATEAVRRVTGWGAQGSKSNIPIITLPIQYSNQK